MIKNLFMIAATLLYVGQIFSYLWARDFPQALMLIGYTAANVGVIWSTL